ncbi:MAG: T9SS type A sorting domain-containing protein [Bacteroidetes bacterium]|nr:T9SS type A sorting domain-containing protein [Bacteroidota bacterium]
MIKKRLLFYTNLYLILYNLSGFSQTPIFNWGQPIGGSHDEIANDIVIPDSSEYYCVSNCPLFVIGKSASDDGNICGLPVLGNQALALNFNTNGFYSSCWQYGGSGFDEFKKGKYLKVGNGYNKLYLGQTTSNDGDVSGNHGGADAWLVRIKFNSIINQKCIGGKGVEGGLDFIEMPDRGFIICGASSSDTIDGIPTNNHGGFDGWITRTDSLGNIIWSKQYGGSSGEYVNSIVRTSDGNFVCAGYTSSTDSAFSVNHGTDDYWIFKIDTLGTLIWQKIYGGTGSDFAYKVLELNSNAIYVSGYTRSFDGDVVGNHSTPGNEDVWVLKLDSLGNFIWKKCYGGSGFEYSYTMTQTIDNNIVITSSGASLDGDLAGLIGYRGIWIFKIDSSGTILWSRQSGNNGSMLLPNSVVSYDSKTFFFTGHPLSSGGDITSFYGGFNDIWMASITDTSHALGYPKNYESTLVYAYPNPVSDKLNLQLSSSESFWFKLFDSRSKLLLESKTQNESEFAIDLSDYPSGIYFLKILTTNQSIIKKIIKTTQP